MKYLICYDITSSKRRAKLSKYLCGKGDRVQKSFFSCIITNTDISEVKMKLETIIDKKKDKIAIYPICDKCLNAGFYIGCSFESIFEDGFVVL